MLWQVTVHVKGRNGGRLQGGGFGWVGEEGGGELQQPAGQFSTGNWWPQRGVWGGRGVERGGRGLRGSEGFLAVRLVSVVCPSAAWPSSPLRTAPVGHHKRQIWTFSLRDSHRQLFRRRRRRTRRSRRGRRRRRWLAHAASHQLQLPLSLSCAYWARKIKCCHIDFSRLSTVTMPSCGDAAQVRPWKEKLLRAFFFFSFSFALPCHYS